jgi:hypothetical protein
MRRNPARVRRRRSRFWLDVFLSSFVSGKIEGLGLAKYVGTGQKVSRMFCAYPNLYTANKNTKITLMYCRRRHA